MFQLNVKNLEQRQLIEEEESNDQVVLNIFGKLNKTVPPELF